MSIQVYVTHVKFHTNITYNQSYLKLGHRTLAGSNHSELLTHKHRTLAGSNH